MHRRLSPDDWPPEGNPQLAEVESSEKADRGTCPVSRLTGTLSVKFGELVQSILFFAAIYSVR
jgi:hypothetical protein